MKGLFLLKDKLQEGDYMFKIDLKVPYFLVLLNEKSQECQMEGSILSASV